MSSIEQQPDIGRRGVLTGAFLTRQGRAEVSLRQNPLGPLPSWLNVSADNCDTCETQCVPACPQNVVKRHPDDHVLSGMPYLEFAAAGCTSCGNCADECPSSELLTDKPASIGKVNISYEKCLTSNSVFCISCVGKCDFGVLKLDKRRQLVSNDADCCGCGMCVHACPVNALEVQLI